MRRGYRLVAGALIPVLAGPLSSGMVSGPAGAQAPASPPAIQWTHWVDPYEHAFSLEVPAGWRIEGGFLRVAPLNENTYLRLMSPDGAIYLGFNDPETPSFIPPGPTTPKEGTVYSPGLGQVTMVLPHMSGAEYAVAYAKRKVAALCGGTFTSRGTRSRPDMAKLIGSQIGVTNADAGEAVFSCTHAKLPSEAHVVAVTHSIPGMINGMWFVDWLGIIVAPEAQVATAQAIGTHMFQTFKFDPAWNAKQAQYVAQINQAIANRMQNFLTQEQHILDSQRAGTHIAQRFSAIDQNFQAMDDIINDSHVYHDGDGNQYWLDNTRYQWKDPQSGRIVATTNNVPPGAAWVALSR